jgi:hypothetical protein
MNIRELSSFPVSRVELSKEGQELFYRDKLSSFSIEAAITVFPIGALCLILRLSPSHNVKLLIFIASMAVTTVLLCYFVLVKRRLILKLAYGVSTDLVNHNAAEGKFATETEAQSNCPGDTVVWVNLDTGIYHYNGTKNYGTSKRGIYMCTSASIAAGYRAAKNERTSTGKC